jgi:hypothetical protein
MNHEYFRTCWEVHISWEGLYIHLCLCAASSDLMWTEKKWLTSSPTGKLPSWRSYSSSSTVAVKAGVHVSTRFLVVALVCATRASARSQLMVRSCVFRPNAHDRNNYFLHVLYDHHDDNECRISSSGSNSTFCFLSASGLLCGLESGYQHFVGTYSGRRIIESLGNVTVRGEKDGKSKGESVTQQSVWACIV